MFLAPTEAPLKEDEQTSNSVQEVVNDDSSGNTNSNTNGGIVALRVSYITIIYMIERFEILMFINYIYLIISTDFDYSVQPDHAPQM